MRRKTLALIGALLVTPLLAGAGYQAITTARTRSELAPPGRMIPVDGIGMHLHCEGEGRPTVVLEAGATGFAQTWARIQPRIARETRVCSYDRAGMGWSQATEGPVDGAAAATRLERLLEQAGETGPFVLVGHSMGGPIVTTFAAAAPEEVAAIAMVDPSHPDQLDTFPAEVARNQDRFVTMVGLAARVAPLGIIRLTNILGRNAAALPDEAYRAARFFGSSPAHLRTSHRELLAWDATMAAARRAPNLGNLLLLVLSADANMAGMPEGFIDINHRLHRDLAGRSTRGRHLVVEGADHFSIIMSDEHARRTADLLLEVVAEVRGQASDDGAMPAGGAASITRPAPPPP